ncbi:MAG: alpha/beta hydrolase [Solirubrobacterales bacterium]|nr:alpha/beta hydrolase [Solirubrobacterales bacterium]
MTYVDLVAELDGVTTLAANPPGFAQNAPPPGLTYATTEYAELIERLAAAERIDMLAGHSLSANILIEVAARNNFTGPIVLLDPCLRFRNEYRSVRLLRRLERVPPLAKRAYAATTKSFPESMKGLIRPERLDEIVTDMQKTPPEQNRAVINGYFDHLEQYGTLAARLADARGEIHYVRGDAESIGFDREDIEKIVAQENVTTHAVTNSDHFTMLDNPKEVSEILVAALDLAGGRDL